MNDDLMRQVGALQTTVDDIKKPEISRNVIVPFASLPGLIGLWYGGNYQRSTGDMPNLAPYISGASSQDLSYNGNPNFDYLANGVGFVDLDGTGDYFSIADNTDLDVLGTESYITKNGMYCGGIFNLSSLATISALITKGTAGTPATSTFECYVNVDGSIVIRVSTGAAYISAISSAGDISTGEWFKIDCVYIPSTSLTIYKNGISIGVQTVGVPAALHNTAQPFVIGSFTALVLPMTGSFSIGYYGANYLTQSIIQSGFQQTRSLYGV